MAESPSARILVIDGDPSVHEELDRILGAPEAGDRPLAKLRSMIFGEPAGEARATGWEVVHAASGDEGAALLRAAVLEGRPCACALVDLGTAPAWEGLATVETLAAIDPDLPIVVATALADRSWEDAVRRAKGGERLLMLKKPFEGAEILQLAIALAAQRELARDGRARIAELESLVASRNHDLAAANDVLRTRLSQTILARRKAQDAILALQASNRDLERARSEALDASRSKSEFLTSMSHEIRTPMTAILGYAELLGEAGLSRDEVTRHVTTIRKNGEHLLALISDILDVSRIEAGMVSVERSACSPGTILAAVVELMSVRASAKGLRLVLEAPSPLPKTIQTDETRFQQILLNLVGNAIKFTDIGSVRLVARIVEAREGSGPWLAVDVQDTGIGLAPEQIGLLFKPFSRVDGSSSRRFGGTGLGLSISRKLAEHLGGTVTVQSRTGDGSTFTATVETGPLEGIERVELSRRTRSALPAAAEPGEAECRVVGRVLLVDDGADNRRLVRLILSRAGATVDLAEDGREACVHMTDALAKGPRYDLVLMDMQMPGLDGYQTTGEMRRIGYKGPILALTAHAMAGDRERCLAAGCDEYATKPIQRQALLAVCAELLRRLDSIPAALPAPVPRTAKDPRVAEDQGAAEARESQGETT